MTNAPVTGSCVLSPAITRLIEVIEEENAVLRENVFTFHRGFTDRKNQALRELMAAQRQETVTASAAAVRPQLQELSSVLQDNARLLKLHIAAAGDISDIIVSSLREAESDGTYSRNRLARSW